MKTTDKKKLNDCVDRHRTAIEMAASKRTIPKLAEWLVEEYGDEIPDSARDMEALCVALLQFYRKGAE